MTKTEKLYRKPPSYFKKMTAEEASKEKIKCAEEHIRDLQKVELFQRDDYLIIKLKEAINHHEFLLEEDDDYKEYRCLI